MAYGAVVLNVMIASPGDVAAERQIVRDVLEEWNHVNSRSRGCVLMALGWDTHSAPELGGRPQQLINDRVLVHADILVGIFWTRVGTETGRAVSGSVEEIDEHRKKSKPVMLYFSSTPVRPDSVESAQYEKLKEFKQWASGEGLVESYDGDLQFKDKFRRHIEILLTENQYIVGLLDTLAEPARNPGLPAEDRPSAEAIELLLAADADPGGNILSRRHLGGQEIFANGHKFGGAGKRDYARYEAALEELQALGLVKWRSEAVREITNAGYKLAEKLK